LNIIKHYAPLKSLNIIYINMIQLAHFFMIHQIHFVITLTASSIRDQEMQPTRKICSTSSLYERGLIHILKWNNPNGITAHHGEHCI